MVKYKVTSGPNNSYLYVITECENNGNCGPLGYFYSKEDADKICAALNRDNDSKNPSLDELWRIGALTSERDILRHRANEMAKLLPNLYDIDINGEIYYNEKAVAAIKALQELVKDLDNKIKIIKGDK
ncbi:hypothetical protein M0R04_15245 [Candidatus Dojkabacteria bacterium]|jgi:hypothetical protein|nr:hypothetical protein [Candidatus Dojkabacteria bacterium]